MSLLLKGARRLSELVIDTDKDWATSGITNVKELAATMAKGDILFSGGTHLIKLPSGPIGACLTTHDFGADPSWTYPP